MELDVLSPGDIKLEEECSCIYQWQPTGKFIRLDAPTSDCSKCGGSGMEPTEFGQQVLAFVQKHLKKD